MSRYFLQDTPLADLEREMMRPHALPIVPIVIAVAA